MIIIIKIMDFKKYSDYEIKFMLNQELLKYIIDKKDILHMKIIFNLTVIKLRI